MMQQTQTSSVKSMTTHLFGYLWIALGSFLAAFSIKVFMTPNKLIDGGTVGVAMIFAYIFGNNLLPVFLLLLTIPFLYMAYRYIGKVFVIHMLFALGVFAGFLVFIEQMIPWQFKGESLEVVVIGGAILGIGIGMIIRYGGCLDGTEILGIIVNRGIGITVGQVVLFCNIFIFGIAGVVFRDWHPPILSLIMYMVATKVMDAVIVGLEETKEVLIISSKSKQIAEAIINEMGLGLTIMYGRGGFSGDAREIIYVIAERLQLAELKELIYREDKAAFISIKNLHEVSNGTHGQNSWKNKRIEHLVSRIFRPS